jgi:glycosyltransferase involved in cell wall biosynthesis
MTDTTCIIPFYNEGRSIIGLLEKLQKVKALSQIICVDDGSTDFAYWDIKKMFPNVVLLKKNKNTGKADAVRKGLQFAEAKTVLLMDADIKDIDCVDIENGLSIFKADALDMLILRKVHSPLFLKVTGLDILISGLRIINRDDLKKVLQQNVKGYQIEFAINKYMQKNNKNVLWTYCSGRNTLKIHKIGLIKGLKKEIQMYINIFSYIGFSGLAQQFSIVSNSHKYH